MDRDISLINDIYESAVRIKEKTENIDYDEFCSDLDIQDIVIRRFLIIGEASGRLSLEFRRHHSKLPYNEMKAMRNILIHEYDYVSNQILWDTIKDDLPAVIEKCGKILQEYFRDGD